MHFLLLPKPCVFRTASHITRINHWLKISDALLFLERVRNTVGYSIDQTISSLTLAAIPI